MKPELYIAKRFAFKRRSASKPTFIVIVAVAGIALGTAALILTLSIVNGFARSVENKLISFSAHMQIRLPDEQLFQERRSDLAKLVKNANIANASPFLEKSFVLRSRNNGVGDVWLNKPVRIKGVNEESRKIFLKKFFREGNIAPINTDKGLALYIGQTLAENLNLKIGKKVMLVSLGGGQSGTKLIVGQNNIVYLLSSLDLEPGVICGIYDTGLQEGFDDYIVLADLKELQQRFNPMMISGYDVNVHKLDQLSKTLTEVADALGFQYYGYTVFDRYANLFEWLKLQKNITPLLIVTITIVAVFNIISTLLVLIIEKTREIGMLSALGLEPGKLSSIFMVQAFLISLSGIAVGNIMAISLSLFEMRYHLITLPEKSYFIKYVPLLINPVDYALVSLAVMALTLLFAFIPARIAASLQPGTALGT